MSGCDRVSRTSSTTAADPCGPTCGRLPLDDRNLIGRRLVADGDPTHAVGDRGGDAGRADRVERVHGSDEPEPGRGDDPAEPRHAELAFAHHCDEHVERFLGDPVQLLDVEQAAEPEGGHQRAVDERLARVPIAQDDRRVEVPDQPGRCELGVALDELETDAEFVRHRAQHRRLAGARRALEHHVPARSERGDQQLDFSAPADHRSLGAFHQGVHMFGRYRTARGFAVADRLLGREGGSAANVPPARREVGAPHSLRVPATTRQWRRASNQETT